MTDTEQDDMTLDERYLEDVNKMRRFRPEKPLGSNYYLGSEWQNPFPEQD